MAAQGTTVANLLSDPEEPAQRVLIPEDTLEGGSARDALDLAAPAVSDNSHLWTALGAPQPSGGDAPAAGGGDEGTAEPVSVDPVPADPAPAGDPLPNAIQMPAVGGASLVAGEWHDAGGMRIAIGDWNDAGWVGILPWWGDGEGGWTKQPYIDGDGFDDVVPGDGNYDYGEYDYSWYGDGSYAGDGDYEGDGGYDYSGYYGYSLTATGDINGDGFEDYLYEGYGESYVMYGYDGDEYTYGGDGFDAGGDGAYDYDYSGYYSYALGDVNGDGFEDYLIGGPAYSYTLYGYAETGNEGDGGGDVTVGDYGDDVYVIYTSGLEGKNISIQALGRAEVIWTDDRIIINATGDNPVVVSIGEDEVVFGGESATPHLSLSNVRLSVASFTGETPVVFVDS